MTREDTCIIIGINYGKIYSKTQDTYSTVYWFFIYIYIYIIILYYIYNTKKNLLTLGHGTPVFDESNAGNSLFAKS